MRKLVAEANALYNSGEFAEALSLYRAADSVLGSDKRIFEYNIESCMRLLDESKREDKACSVSSDARTEDIYITFTTINSRLDKILPVIDSLHNQSLIPKKIILNLSEEAYLLDEGVNRNDPRLSELRKYPLLEINWTKNTGPYRKIVPFLERFFSETFTEDRVFITVDDDTIYPNYFVERLYSEYVSHNSVVAFRGRYIELGEAQVAPYKRWRKGETSVSVNNLPTGKDGIIYSTKFFTPDFLDMEAASRLAPTADDLWIKWHCSMNGVKAKILNPEASTSDYKSFPVVDYSDEYRDVSLFRAHNADSSGGKNDLSVAELEKYSYSKYGYNLFSLCEA